MEYIFVFYSYLRAETAMFPPMNTTQARSLGFAVGLCALALGSVSQAQIKQPNSHISYSFELEPHLLLGPISPLDPDDDAMGLGFRGTYELVDPGFIMTINNTVGIGFGLDHQDYITRIPVVMQWNFWLHEKFSVYGEPGIAFRVRNKVGRSFDPFVMYVGGRWHFTEFAALTLRLGHPVASIGVSFFI